ncbi:MAG TPA: M56 family metallopeptidase [Acidobacteriaceae bacterium]|nr:M56 family metallopeptidase [Acidobacteriaceae bacterium]
MIPGNLSSLGTAVANHLWQSTLFALGTALITLLLRKNQARARFLLWLAASIKFLIPFSLLIELGGHLAALNHVSEMPVFYFVIAKVSQPFGQTSNLRGASASLLQFLPATLALLWMIGFVTVSVIYWSRWRRAAAAKRDALPVFDGREVEALRRLEPAAGIRRPIPLLSSRGSLEPGVFGIIYPVLLWPEKISQHLDDAHVEAILVHEIQHVRRRDNLAAAIHMLVETLFWFYPLVWWLGARMVEERERACDEAVLQLGNPPHVYAESILRTCKFSMSSPLACISGVTGGDLKRRIVRIMSPRAADRLGLVKKVLLTAIGIGAVAGPIFMGFVKAPVASAQSSSTKSNAQPVGTTPVPYAPNTKIYHVGRGVSAPTLIYAPNPQYTEKARKAKYQGVCVIALIVDAAGNPQRVLVVRHLGMGLDQKAVEAVKQYRFDPAMLNGKPVPVEVNIEVNFRVS